MNNSNSIAAWFKAAPFFLLSFIFPGNAGLKEVKTANKGNSKASCCQRPARYIVFPSSTSSVKQGDTSNKGMLFIPAGTFLMGGDNEQAVEDELPKHAVQVSGFWMDEHEVTNAQFSEFVAATGYVTTAEKKPDWDELQKQLPPGTSRPDDKELVPASLVFLPVTDVVHLTDYSQWWRWVPGADWRHPYGPESDIKDKQDYPVIHVSWDDAIAYCQWAGKRLPTEAEWEYAARGKLQNKIYPWGNEGIAQGKAKANSWDGTFPNNNTGRDGFKELAPVKSFPANGYRLFDMAGNVWEWCADWYRSDYYENISKNGTSINPAGPPDSYDPAEPLAPKKVARGGSFLCNDSYCSGYRVARRMKTTYDSGMSNIGFRCVK